MQVSFSMFQYGGTNVWISPFLLKRRTQVMEVSYRNANIHLGLKIPRWLYGGELAETGQET